MHFIIVYDVIYPEVDYVAGSYQCGINTGKSIFDLIQNSISLNSF